PKMRRGKQQDGGRRMVRRHDADAVAGADAPIGEHGRRSANLAGELGIGGARALEADALSIWRDLGSTGEEVVEGEIVMPERVKDLERLHGRQDQDTCFATPVR